MQMKMVNEASHFQRIIRCNAISLPNYPSKPRNIEKKINNYLFFLTVVYNYRFYRHKKSTNLVRLKPSLYAMLKPSPNLRELGANSVDQFSLDATDRQSKLFADGLQLSNCEACELTSLRPAGYFLLRKSCSAISSLASSGRRRTSLFGSTAFTRRSPLLKNWDTK